MEIDEEKDHFYYSFKSTDGLQTFPNNSTENFRITLKEPLHLKGEWEVGLSSLFIPHLTKYKFNSVFKMLIHIPDIPSRNPNDDKYWLELELSSNSVTMRDLFQDLKGKITAAIKKFDSSLNVSKYITFHDGPYNWYPSYRVKWGSIIAMSTHLAELLKIDWKSGKYLKIDFSERTYGLRTINQGNRGRDGHNLLQLWGSIWLTLNPTQRINIGTFLGVANNINLSYLIKNLQLKNKELEEKSKLHTDKLYHNTMLVKTNLIKQIHLTNSEFKNVIRTVALPQVEENHQYDFSPVFYFPVRVNVISTIKIKLKRFKLNDIIDHVTFEGDTSIVILHFRRRHSIL